MQRARRPLLRPKAEAKAGASPLVRTRAPRRAAPYQTPTGETGLLGRGGRSFGWGLARPGSPLGTCAAAPHSRVRRSPGPPPGTSPSAKAASGPAEFSSGSCWKPPRPPGARPRTLPKVGACGARSKGPGAPDAAGRPPALRAPRPSDRRPVVTHRRVWTGPALSRCHRPAPALQSEPCSRLPLPRYLLGGAGSASKLRGIWLKIQAPELGSGARADSPPAALQPAASKPLMGSLHFLSIIMSDREVNAKRPPEGRHLLPSPARAGARRVRVGRGLTRRCGPRAGSRRPAAAEGRHTRPMEVRSSKLHGAPALPPDTLLP